MRRLRSVGSDFSSQPVASFAQATTTFSGEAVALRARAVGISLALSDTGALPSSGGNLSTSLASLNVLGLASAPHRQRRDEFGWRECWIHRGQCTARQG